MQILAREGECHELLLNHSSQLCSLTPPYPVQIDIYYPPPLTLFYIRGGMCCTSYTSNVYCDIYAAKSFGSLLKCRINLFLGSYIRLQGKNIDICVCGFQLSDGRAEV